VRNDIESEYGFSADTSLRVNQAKELVAVRV